MICGQTGNGQCIITGIDLTTYHVLLHVNLRWGITDASSYTWGLKASLLYRHGSKFSHFLLF